MIAHRPLSLVFLLAFVAALHARQIDFLAQRPGHAQFYPHETAVLPDPAPPKPVDLPQRAVAIVPTAADLNRRGGIGAGVVVATLSWLAALAWTMSWLFRPIP